MSVIVLNLLDSDGFYQGDFVVGISGDNPTGLWTAERVGDGFYKAKYTGAEVNVDTGELAGGSWIDVGQPDPDVIYRYHEARRNQLLEESAEVTSDWRAEASIGEISDEDRVKLKAWLAYNKAVKATAVGGEWPPVPES